MAWKFNDLALGLGSVVEGVSDSPEGLDIRAVVTLAERRQLQAMAEHAGRVDRYTPPLGVAIILDGSPHGENVVYVTPDPDTTAPDMVDEGWYLWQDLGDDLGAARSRASMNLTLLRVGGPHECEGITSVVAEFLTHDY